MYFENREHAARLLAEKLSGYQGKNPLVLGIPRGAVTMARIIADRLGGELDVVLVRKLGAPSNPEFAIGSVDESGHTYITDYARDYGFDPQYLEREKQAQMRTLKERRELYTPARAPIDPAARVVIVVDDGVATGSTMIAALRAVKAGHPAKLIAALGVAPPGAIARLRKEADEVVCIYTPEEFFAVGQFFAEFSQVADAEVISLLQSADRSASAESGGD